MPLVLGGLGIFQMVLDHFMLQEWREVRGSDDDSEQGTEWVACL